MDNQNQIPQTENDNQKPPSPADGSSGPSSLVQNLSDTSYHSYTAPHVENAPPQPPHKPFMLSKILLLLALAIILLTTGAIYFALNSKLKSMPKKNASPITKLSPAPTLAQVADETANWKTYVNKEFSFSFKYPESYQLKDETESYFTIWLSNYTNDIYSPPQEGFLDINVSASKDKTKILEDLFADYYQTIKGSNVGDSKTINNFYFKSQGSGRGPWNLTYTRQEDTLTSGYKGLTFSLDWESAFGSNYKYVVIIDRDNILYEIWVGNIKDNVLANLPTFKAILSTFKFTNSEISPTPTCKPRPACLDATPRCSIAETSDMCRPSVTPPGGGGIACAQDAKLCPDGKTYVSRQGPKCEFAPCPGQ